MPEAICSFEQVIYVWHLVYSFYPCWISAVIFRYKAQMSRQGGSLVSWWKGQFYPQLPSAQLPRTCWPHIWSQWPLAGVSGVSAGRCSDEQIKCWHTNDGSFVSWQIQIRCISRDVVFLRERHLSPHGAESTGCRWQNDFCFSSTVGFPVTGNGILGSMEYFLFTC